MLLIQNDFNGCEEEIELDGHVSFKDIDKLRAGYVKADTAFTLRQVQAAFFCGCVTVLLLVPCGIENVKAPAVFALCVGWMIMTRGEA
jgi:hypothetical protein